MCERLRGLGKLIQYLPLLIVTVCAFIASAYMVDGTWKLSFPVDDAWIHMVYGRSLWTEGSMSYNSGQPSTGCTSPLWVAFAALSHGLSGASEPSWEAAAWLKCFGILFHVLTSILAGKVTAGISESFEGGDHLPRGFWELGGGVICGIHPTLVYASVSGMEVSLTAFLLLFTLYLVFQQRSFFAGVSMGLSMAARPEAVVAVPILLLMIWVSSVKRKDYRSRQIVYFLLPVAVIIGLLVGRTMIVSGAPFPATYYGKVGLQGMSFFHAMSNAWKYSISVFPLVGEPVFLVGIFAVCLGVYKLSGWDNDHIYRVRVFIWIIFFEVVMWFFASVVSIPPTCSHFYFQRYLLPAVPSVLILGVVLPRLVVSLLRFHAIAARVVAVLVVTAFIFMELVQLPSTREAYRRGGADIHAVNVRVGQQLATFLTSPDTVVWSVDAGGIRYWSGHRVLDLMALNTREITTRNPIPSPWSPDVVIINDTSQGLYISQTGYAPIRRIMRACGVGPNCQSVYMCRGDFHASDRRVTVVSLPQRGLLARGDCRVR